MRTLRYKLKDKYFPMKKLENAALEPTCVNGSGIWNDAWSGETENVSANENEIWNENDCGASVCTHVTDCGLCKQRNTI